MIIADQWTDYKLLDAGDKEKVESWKGIILRRPDPRPYGPGLKLGYVMMSMLIITGVMPVEAVGSIRRRYPPAGI